MSLKRYFINIKGFSIQEGTFKTNDGYKLQETSLDGKEISCHKKGDEITFRNNYMCAPRIAYLKNGSRFIFTLDRDTITHYLNRHFPECTPQPVIKEPMCNFKNSVKSDFEYPMIQFIENWSEVVIKADGSFEIKKPSEKPYTVELKDAYDLVHDWLIKYKRLIRFLTNKDEFVPTLTGGLDTRAFTALYRDEISKISSYFMYDTKPDGLEMIEAGQDDLKCASAVAERLGIKNRVETTKHKVTLTGMHAPDDSRIWKLGLNDPLFISKFIQHHSPIHGALAPYTDDLFLKIKQPDFKVWKALMCLLLCPDLLDISCHSEDDQAYDFYNRYAEAIEEAKKIIEYWGEDKVAHILDENHWVTN